MRKIKATPTKAIKLRAFEIVNNNLSAATSGLMEKLLLKLNTSEITSERCMVLNSQEENPEKDLISDYTPTPSSKGIFCTMLRIKPGKDIQQIEDIMMEKKSFTLADLKGASLNAAAIYKEHYYFFIKNDHLITNLNNTTTITRLQTYLTWYLEEACVINPSIEDNVIRDLQNIKTLTIKDPINDSFFRSHTRDLFENEDSEITISDLAVKLFRYFFVATAKIPEMEIEKLIAAKLTIDISDPKELKRKYAALLKPISDIDQLNIHSLDNKIYKKGDEIQTSKTVEIDLTDSGKINENTLMQAMEAFIDEIESYS